ncbi:MAG: tyrosine-type recombinase/integrase, partial [Ignavibacteria bacterium]
VFRRILKSLKMESESYNLKTFRKTFASNYADKGIGEGDLADLLGHSTTNTTRIYYKKKNASIIKERLNNVNIRKNC